jgi:hypothetical protein
VSCRPETVGEKDTVEEIKPGGFNHSLMKLILTFNESPRTQIDFTDMWSRPHLLTIRQCGQTVPGRTGTRMEASLTTLKQASSSAINSVPGIYFCKGGCAKLESTACLPTEGTVADGSLALLFSVQFVWVCGCYTRTGVSTGRGQV